MTSPPAAHVRLRATVVIPCFNEEQRLDPRGVEELLTDADTRVVLVDDGSVDNTKALIERIASTSAGRVTAAVLRQNRGKAEAVREGLRVAVGEDVDIVAYLDADFATSAAEMQRIIDTLRAAPALKAAIGARVALLGHHIERKAARHFLGRVFATAASLVLGVHVYDTQCGAKAFRVDDVFKGAIAAPFTSRWVFDVELLERLLSMGSGDRADMIAEVPLKSWRDVRGSKLGPAAMAHAAWDLGKIAARRGPRSR